MKLFSKERRKNKRRLYSSYKWKKFSLKFRKNHPLCERCLAKGIHKLSKVADHDDPSWKGPGMFTKNLNSLCLMCHKEKTFFEDLPKLKLEERLKWRYF